MSGNPNYMRSAMLLMPELRRKISPNISFSKVCQNSANQLVPGHFHHSGCFLPLQSCAPLASPWDASSSGPTEFNRWLYWLQSNESSYNTTQTSCNFLPFLPTYKIYQETNPGSNNPVTQEQFEIFHLHIYCAYVFHTLNIHPVRIYRP